MYRCFSIIGGQRGRLVFSDALLHIKVGKCKTFASLFTSLSADKDLGMGLTFSLSRLTWKTTECLMLTLTNREFAFTECLF